MLLNELFPTSTTELIHPQLKELCTLSMHGYLPLDTQVVQFGDD